MKIPQQTNALSRNLQEFFADYLPLLRGLSPHTIHSYRDCLALLLRFVAEKTQRSVTELDIKDLDTVQIVAFLQMLEDSRQNSVATRNIRLAAIHVFFRYLAGKDPEILGHCQQILAIPFKRSNSRIVEYLEYDEIQAVLSAVDRITKDGQRDYILLVTMFNTGARVQEILDLRICDLQLIKPFQARLIGKGRKERLCPIWEQTAQLLQEMIAHRGNVPLGERVFLNHRKQPLTRFGIRYLLAKYCDIARKNTPTLLNKRLHPHSMRHSTAVHLLKSGVDIVTISHWLGHANINTTNRYMSVDLDMKREAINKIKIDTTNPNSNAYWRSDASILTWLESL
jgi:site-specific recombinase XerD